MLAKAIIMSKLLTYFAVSVTGNGLFCGGTMVVFEIFIGSTVVFFAIIVKRVPAVHFSVCVCRLRRDFYGSYGSPVTEFMRG